MHRMPSNYPQPPAGGREHLLDLARHFASIAAHVVVDPERGRFSWEWVQGDMTLIVDPDTKAALDAAK
jgi:hypothetical protein